MSVSLVTVTTVIVVVTIHVVGVIIEIVTAILVCLSYRPIYKTFRYGNDHFFTVRYIAQIPCESLALRCTTHIFWISLDSYGRR